MAKVKHIDGVHVFRFEAFSDERGSFQRVYDRNLLSAGGTLSEVFQASFSHNSDRGVLRGLHYLSIEIEETKLVSCVHGRVFDVIVDARVDSPTYLDHMTMTLESEVPTTLMLPPGCAHGYMTLTKDAGLVYMMNTAYSAEAERGFRFDDPTLDIVWPSIPQVVSEKDLDWPWIQRA